jgi:anaphase-promoting complex subunit 5
MGRYLTPAKVALLTLIVLYAEGVVPNAETISVLSFLTSQIVTDGPRSSRRFSTSAPPSTRSYTPSPASTPPCISSDICHVTRIEDFERALSSLSSAIPGRTLWDLFLKKLWTIDCSYALDQLISNALSLVTKSREQLLRDRDEGIPPSLASRISRTSPVGAFVRRAHLEYTRLQFSDAATLWQKFILYRSPTRLAFEKKNPLEGGSPLDVNLSNLQIDSSHPITHILYGGLENSGDDVEENFTSTHDVEKLMEFQVSELQRKCCLLYLT